MAGRAAHESDDVATLLSGDSDDAPAPTACFVLRVVEGPDAGRELRLDASQPSRALVGQGPACDLRLSDREVSRRHAALDLAGRRIRIVDLGSTNGTFVDGVAVVDAFLSGGELVRLGATALRVDRGETALPAVVPEVDRFGALVGASSAMRRLYPLCEKLAASGVPVVIEGETGTGKEALAESMHDTSPRASGPFVVFDCTAAPASLVDSELFGHERGAFTGAVAARRGVFEQAHGGTLLIDEIGDLDLALQPKLLRALERSEIRRVGGEQAIKVDVRVLAATRRDLDKQVMAGRFRDDLFHRLAVARIELPPLRQRRGDVSLLARHFWKQMGGEPAGPPADFLASLEDHTWPGNVRELRNAIARHIALGDLSPKRMSAPGAQPKAEAGSDLMDQVLALDLPLARARQQVVEAFERRYIQRVLDQHGGNVTKAAAASGLARRYFQILLRSR